MDFQEFTERYNQKRIQDRGMSREEIFAIGVMVREEMLRYDLSLWLRRTRKSKRLTRAKLGKRARVPKTEVKLIEHSWGNPRFVSIARLAEALDVVIKFVPWSHRKVNFDLGENPDEKGARPASND